MKREGQEHPYRGSIRKIMLNIDQLYEHIENLTAAMPPDFANDHGYGPRCSYLRAVMKSYLARIDGLTLPS